MMHASAYAGDVTPQVAWEGLSAHSQAALVDVRTRAEWAFVGIVDLASLSRKPLCVEWQMYPTMEVNTDFVASVVQGLQQQGSDKGSPIYFLCRSGVRSMAAATAMTQAGYSQAYNILGGFEGNLDPARHRVGGWKTAGLPWFQT